ncbi:MAG: hypothetical protein IJ588_08660 [Prevotella sp.]|nr:hypothetical protein [Prevotella sp.]
MKKRLLMVAFALLTVATSFAFQPGDYAYTVSQRFKIAGDDLVKNGNFASNRDGWYGADKETGVSATEWDLVQGVGPNGEAALQTLGVDASQPLCNSWQINDGGYYVISLQIKGESIGTTSIIEGGKAAGNNAVDFFLNGDGIFTKAASTADAPVTNVAQALSYGTDWTTLCFSAYAEAGQYIVMHLEKLAAGTMITNIEIRKANAVYDDRALKRMFEFADAIVENENFTKDPDDFKNGVYPYLKGLVETAAEGSLDDISEIESYITTYNEGLNNLLKANGTDLFAAGLVNSAIINMPNWNEGKAGNSQNDWQFRGYSGSGNRWGHRHATSKEYYTYSIQSSGSYQLGRGACYVQKEGLAAGKYMFAADVFGFPYTSEYNISYIDSIPGVKIFAGIDDSDTENVTFKYSTEAAPLDTRNFHTYVVIFDLAEGEKLTAGVYYPGYDKYKGGSFRVGNAKLYRLGETEDDVKFKAEVEAIILQQAEVAKRIKAIDEEDMVKTKADGFPWGREELKTKRDSIDVLYQASLEIIDAEGKVLKDQDIRDSLAMGSKISDLVLSYVRALNSARNAYSNLNKSFTTLQATVAEAEETLTSYEGKGDASRRSALQTAVSQAKALIEGTVDGSDGSDQAQFDEKNTEIANLRVDYLNSTASKENPIAQNLLNANFDTNTSNWTLTTDNANGAFKWGNSADRGAAHTTYIAAWRGNTASPNNKAVQTIKVKDAGVYVFNTSAYAFNESGGSDAKMLTFIDATDELVADTLFDASECKMFFGLNGDADSVRVHSHYYPKNNCTTYTGYRMSRYTVVYVKTTDVEEELEVGMSTEGNIANAGANTFGFADNEILYVGPAAAYLTAVKDDMAALISKAQTTLAAAEDATAGQYPRLARFLNHANRVVAGEELLKSLSNSQTAESKSLKNILNAYNDLKEALTDIENTVTGISPITTATPATTDGAIYTISGMKVNKITKPGLYIQNGKKFVIK